MANNFYKKIRFTSYDGGNGVLTALQSGDKPREIPFTVRRVLIMRGMKRGDRRGGHTHHKTRQILFALHGTCRVMLDNGKKKASVTLSRPDEGLLLEPYVWHVLGGFTKDTVLLVLADTRYDERDYIRNYEDFKKYAKK